MFVVFGHHCEAKEGAGPQDEEEPYTALGDALLDGEGFGHGGDLVGRDSKELCMGREGGDGGGGGEGDGNGGGGGHEKGTEWSGVVFSSRSRSSGCCCCCCYFWCCLCDDVAVAVVVVVPEENNAGISISTMHMAYCRCSCRQRDWFKLQNATHVEIKGIICVSLRR